MQQRQHGRYRLWFPVRITSTGVDGMAVNHNISAGGMLIALSARLEVDSPVEIRFSVPTAAQSERVMRGKVVRIEDNADDPDGLTARDVQRDFFRQRAIELGLDRGIGRWNQQTDAAQNRFSGGVMR